MVDLRSDDEPAVHELAISGIPADFSFHPHGLHLDNATQRLFAVCHAKTVPLQGPSSTTTILGRFQATSQTRMRHCAC